MSAAVPQYGHRAIPAKEVARIAYLKAVYELSGARTLAPVSQTEVLRAINFLPYTGLELERLCREIAFELDDRGKVESYRDGQVAITIPGIDEVEEFLGLPNVNTD